MMVEVSKKHCEVRITSGDEFSIWKEKTFSAGQAEEARIFFLSLEGKPFHKWDNCSLVEDGKVNNVTGMGTRAPVPVEDIINALS